MFPAATLIVDVCVQRDFWPGGALPLVDPWIAESIARLFRTVAAPPVRRGRLICRHDQNHSGHPVHRDAPVHCETEGAREYPPGLVLRDSHERVVESGCGVSPDASPHHVDFKHLVGGVRDAVVFGAGLEYAIAHVVEALFRFRIRTHLVIDAVASASEVEAQLLVAGWKRRGLDLVTVEGLERLLVVR